MSFDEAKLRKVVREAVQEALRDEINKMLEAEKVLDAISDKTSKAEMRMNTIISDAYYRISRLSPKEQQDFSARATGQPSYRPFEGR